MARDLQEILNYSRWESFEALIERARGACDGSGVPSENHFRQTAKMVAIGSGAERRVKDLFLSRYACYLVAMNGDPQVAEVAFAQQYFAVQTRLQEQTKELEARYDRIEHRRRVSAAIKALSSAAKQAGVQRYGLFYDAGYRGLYDGLGLSEIKAKKGILGKDDLLDRAGRQELAANEFKAAMTEQKLIREKVQGEKNASDTHFLVGREVRAAIRRIGGQMPEDLKPEESIKKLAATQKKKKKLPPPAEG